MPSFISAPTLSLVCLPALRAFHPSPESGTLFAPTMEVSPEIELAPSVLIQDGEVASDFDMFALLLLGEVSEVNTHLKSVKQPFPYQVPATNDKGTPWFIENFKTGDDGAPGSAKFYTPMPSRWVEIDQRSAAQTQVSYGIVSHEGAFTQAILIDSSSYEVSTGYYLAQIRAKTFENALRIALLTADAFYTCGQYVAEHELGALQYCVDNEAEWTDLFFEADHFLPPDLDPNFHGDLSFASAASVFADVHGGFRQAVVAMDLMPTESLDMPSAEPPPWLLEIAMHRPPDRSLGLMPLTKRLRYILWKPIFDRIFANPQ